MKETTEFSYKTNHAITKEEFFDLLDDVGPDIALEDLLKDRNYLPSLDNLDLRDLTKHELSIINFQDVSLRNSIFYTSDPSMLKERMNSKQQEQSIILDIQEENIVKQRDLIDNFPTLNRKGVCNGLCMDYSRHYLKHIERAGGLEGSYVNKIFRKIEKPSKRYIERIQTYQLLLQASILDTNPYKMFPGEAKNFSHLLPRHLQNTQIIGLSIPKHIIVISQSKNEDDITEYKIFDPNIGEIICKSPNLEIDLQQEENNNKLNDQLHQILRFYNKSFKDIPFQTPCINLINLENIITEMGLTEDKNIESDFNLWKTAILKVGKNIEYLVSIVKLIPEDLFSHLIPDIKNSMNSLLYIGNDISPIIENIPKEEIKKFIPEISKSVLNLLKRNQDYTHIINKVPDSIKTLIYRKCLAKMKDNTFEQNKLLDHIQSPVLKKIALLNDEDFRELKNQKTTKVKRKSQELENYDHYTNSSYKSKFSRTK